jgi:uncharacterized protein (DUF1778 family)
MPNALRQAVASRSLNLCVRVTPQERQLLEQAAAQDGIRLSEWVRRSANAAARRLVGRVRLELDRREALALVEQLGGGK